MSSIVFDASVILAAAFEEQGSQRVLSLLSKSAASTVNLAEVQSKLIEKGLSASTAWTVTRGLSNEVVPFDLEQSEIAGSLISSTRTLGLSLGDRACLALAIARKLPVLTADRTWAKLELAGAMQVDVQLLR